MKEPEAVVKMLHAIKDLGVMLDMDDFGTGYSSLACLHQFPFDVLKIDHSFVANIDHGHDFMALVNAVTQLARNLEIRVVAEGIETVDQMLVSNPWIANSDRATSSANPSMPTRFPSSSRSRRIAGQTHPARIA